MLDDKRADEEPDLATLKLPDAGVALEIEVELIVDSIPHVFGFERPLDM